MDLASIAFWVLLFQVVYLFGVVAYVFILQLSITLVWGYKCWKGVKEPYYHPNWDAARNMVVKLFKVVGKVWHGYEVIGLENLPKDGGAIITIYHGPIPMDLCYLHSTLLENKKDSNVVIDRFMFQIPGWFNGLYVLKHFPGSYASCLKRLREGRLVLIAPGGTMEAQLASSNYELFWERRTGFARLAVEAGVPIIPAFTKNIRQAFSVPSILQRIFRPLFERFRVPVIIPYGGLPVKMCTYLGEPIPHNSAQTAEELAEKTRCALRNLIKAHQRIPESFLHALKDRLSTK